jgi:hypothetical protein
MQSCSVGALRSAVRGGGMRMPLTRSASVVMGGKGERLHALWQNFHHAGRIRLRWPTRSICRTVHCSLTRAVKRWHPACPVPSLVEFEQGAR